MDGVAAGNGYEASQNCNNSCGEHSGTVPVPEDNVHLVVPNGPSSKSAHVENGRQAHDVRPISLGLASSPEFELGDSALKRRRTKKKPTCGLPSRKDDVSHTLRPNSPISIDLNRIVEDAKRVGSGSNTGESSTQSRSSSSFELNQTVEIGSHVGFHFESGKMALLGAAIGGGDKHKTSWIFSP